MSNPQEQAVVVVNPPLTRRQDGLCMAVRGYSKQVAYEHLQDHLDHPAKQWCPIGCMTKAMYQRNSDSSQKKMRRNVRDLFRWMLQSGRRFLLIEKTGEHGQITALKIYQGDSDVERQIANAQIAERLRRGELTIDEAKQAASVLLLSTPQT